MARRAEVLLVTQSHSDIQEACGRGRAGSSALAGVFGFNHEAAGVGIRLVGTLTDLQ